LKLTLGPSIVKKILIAVKPKKLHKSFPLHHGDPSEQPKYWCFLSLLIAFILEYCKCCTIYGFLSKSGRLSHDARLHRKKMAIKTWQGEH
jgi:hypothetical protein